MSTSKAFKSGASVSEILASYDAQHAARRKVIGGPNAVVDPPHRRAKASGVKDPAKRKPPDAVTPPDKVRCQGCGNTYSKRAKWVTEGKEQCYRCATSAASTKKKGTTA